MSTFFIVVMILKIKFLRHTQLVSLHQLIILGQFQVLELLILIMLLLMEQRTQTNFQQYNLILLAHIT